MSNRVLILTVIAVVCVAAVLVVGIKMLDDGGNNGDVDSPVRTDLVVGDWIEELSTDTDDGVTTTSIVRLTIESISDGLLTVVTTEDGVVNETQTMTESDFIGLLTGSSMKQSLSEKGTETIDTINGSKVCKVYSGKYNNLDTTVYIGEDDGILYRTVQKFSLFGFESIDVMDLRGSSILLES